MKFRIVFWDVLPYKIIVDRRFRGTCCLHHQGSCHIFTLKCIPKDGFTAFYNSKLLLIIRLYVCGALHLIHFNIKCVLTQVMMDV
jgi:hypothetical protein